MAKRKRTCIKDVTNKWKKYAKPCPGIIEISDYTIAANGKVYNKNDKSISFEEPTKEDIEIGTWFKNTIWGRVKLQSSIKNPLYIRSADMIVLDNCPLVKGNTIEIKTINKTKRRDGIAHRLRDSKTQSSNILFDVTKRKIDANVVIRETIKFLNNHEWAKLIIIKDNEEILVVVEK